MPPFCISQIFESNNSAPIFHSAKFFLYLISIKRPFVDIRTPFQKIETPKEFLRTAFGFQRKGVPLLQEFVYRIYGVFRQVRFHDFALFYSHFIKPFLPYLFRKFEMRSRHSG